jgi:hypothetical protein
MVAYGKGDMARFYLREALRLDPAVMRAAQFWKALALCTLPIGIGRRVMEKRMKFRAVDASHSQAVEHSLRSLKTGEDDK